MAYLHRILRSAAIPSAAFALSNVVNTNKKTCIHENRVDCEATPVTEQSSIKPAAANIDADVRKDVQAPSPEQEILFHGLFPLRQLWKPKLEYPLFDSDWDSRKSASTGDKDKDRENTRYVRKHGVTRHIILIRHGQYDEQHREDEKRILTPLGRSQAELTGKRLAKMIAGVDEKFGPCNVKTIRVSTMARAKETADIIAKQLPGYIPRAEPDPLLNEGRPCHTIPCGRVTSSTIAKTDEGNKRIEEAFQTYFHRADPPDLPKDDENKEDISAKEDTNNVEKNIEGESESSLEENENELKGHPQHEFEIIVCHANVIRYFMCRALQLPPEAWLRMCTFNCSLNYLTIRPTGSVSVRMLGDIGHLPYDHNTFSMHAGYNW